MLTAHRLTPPGVLWGCWGRCALTVTDPSSFPLPVGRKQGMGPVAGSTRGEPRGQAQPAGQAESSTGDRNSEGS